MLRGQPPLPLFTHTDDGRRDVLRALHAATTGPITGLPVRRTGPALRDRTLVWGQCDLVLVPGSLLVYASPSAPRPLRLLRLAAVVDRPALQFEVLHAGGASVFVATDADSKADWLAAIDAACPSRAPRVDQLDAVLSPTDAGAAATGARNGSHGAATGAVAARARLQREWEALELAARLLDDEVRGCERALAAGEVQLAKRLAILAGTASVYAARAATSGRAAVGARPPAPATPTSAQSEARARARLQHARGRHTVLLEALTLRSAKLERLAQTVAQLPAERLALDGGGSNGGGSVIAAAIRGGSSFLPVWRAPRQLGEAAEEMVLALDAQRATLTVLDEAELGGGDDGGRGGEPPPAAIALPFEAIPMLYLGYQACHQRIATAVSAAAGDGARARRGSDGGGGGGAGGEATSFGLAVACDGAPLPLFVETAAELREVAAALRAARALRPPTPVPQLHEGTLLAAPPGSTLGSHLMSWGELWAVLLPGQLLLLPHAAARRPKRVLALGGATLRPPAHASSLSPRAALRRLVHRARGAQQARVRRVARRARRGAPAAAARRGGGGGGGGRGGGGGTAQRVRAVPRAARRARRGPRVAARARERGGDAGGGDARGRREDRGGELRFGGTDGGDADARCAHADGAVARRRLGRLGARDIARAHRPRRRRRGGRRRRRGGRRRRRRGERRAARRGARRRPPDPPAAAGGRAAVGGRLAVGGLRRRRPHAVGGVGRVARDGARRRRRRRARRPRARRRARGGAAAGQRDGDRGAAVAHPHDALRRRPGDGRRRRGARGADAAGGAAAGGVAYAGCVPKARTSVDRPRELASNVYLAADTPVDTPLSAFDSVARALLPVGMDPTGIATPEAAVENRRAGVEAEREDWLLVLGRSLGIDFGS